MRYLITLLLVVLISCKENISEKQKIRGRDRTEVVIEATNSIPTEVFNSNEYTIIKINGKDAIVLNEHLTIKSKLSTDRGLVYSLYKDGTYAGVYTFHSDNKSIEEVISKLTVTINSKDQPFKFK
jgi:hypothetical protein